MKLEYRQIAEKQFIKLPKSEQRKVSRKLITLETDPYAGKPLAGEFYGYYSLRAWPYRILYKITGRTIMVVSIKHRQSVYQ